MPVSIIEQFQLGTNLPLDARYVVNNVNDVSLYWHDGMLIYNSSTNQLFIVKDTSTERIVEILDSSSAQIESIDGSISDLYVDQTAQDVSIKWLADNTYTRIYIDGSLNLKVNQSLFDSSISALTLKDLSQDASIVALRAKDASQDVSINSIWTKFGYVDTSLNNLWIKNAQQDASIIRIDTSINSIIAKNISQDSSIVILRAKDTAQDSSIVILRAKDAAQDASIVRIDGSLNVIFSKNISQDASIVTLRNEDIRQDGSISALFIENDIQDASIVKNYDDITTLYDITASLDSSIVRIDGEIAQLDSSIVLLRAEDVRQDGSLNLLFLENDIQDASIQRIDASLGDYVRKDGDTMTGPLRIDSSLRVQDNATFLGDVGIGGNLRVDGSTTFIHTDTLDVSINWIHLNTGLTGTPPEWLQSGIVIERGDASAFAFLYDETREEFRIGIVNETDASGVYEDTDTQAVATREDIPINTGLAFWNGSEWRFDTSTGLTVGTITNLTSWNISQDASIVALRNKDANIDTSLNNIWVKFGSVDISLNNLGIKNAAQDVSLNNIWVKFGSVDISLNNLGIKNANQDVSLNALWVDQKSQDASIVILRTKDTNIDTSLNNIWVKFGSVDTSLLNLGIKNAAQDVSLNNIWTKLGYVDTSLLNLGIKDANQDISINQLRIYTDGSLNNRVKRTGDNMSGSLIINASLYVDGSSYFKGDVSIGNSLYVNGSGRSLFRTDVSILKNLSVDSSATVRGDLCVKKTLHADTKIHLHQYANPDASWGDLWIEPSTYNLLYKHPLLAGTIDASSYDLTNRLLRTADDWSQFPDSSSLDNGDRILIEDAQDLFKKKWISAQAFSQSATALLYPAYSDALPAQNTTSTTYITALSLTSDPSAKSSTYRIGWTLQIACSKVGKDSLYRILLDGSIVEQAAIASFTADAYSNWSGFQHNQLDLDPSGHTITVEYSATTGATAYIRNVRLEFRKADTAN